MRRSSPFPLRSDSYHLILNEQNVPENRRRLQNHKREIRMKHTFFMLWVLFFLLTTSPLKAVLIKYGEESEGKGHISVSFKTRTSKLRQPPVEGEGPLKEIKIKSGDLEVKFKETVSEFLENKKIHSLGF